MKAVRLGGNWTGLVFSLGKRPYSWIGLPDSGGLWSQAFFMGTKSGLSLMANRYSR